MSTIVHQPTSGHIEGLALTLPKCEDPLLYVAVPSEYFQTIHTMDPYTFMEQYYCTVPIVGRLCGWAGEPPCITPEPCEIIIDLDGDDSTGRPPVDFADSLYCNPAEIAVADADATVYSDMPWDSAEVSIVSPPFSGAVLSGIAEQGILISGAGTSTIWLYNTGGVPPGDLALQLAQLVLVPGVLSADETYTVAVTGYAADLVSDTAFAFLYAGSRLMMAGDDGAVTLCREDVLFDFNTLPDAGAFPGGYWSGTGMPADGIAGLQNFETGVYYYIVIDPVCGPDTAVWDIAMAALPVVDLGPDMILCDGQSLVLYAPPGYDVTWQDGSTGDSLLAAGAGYYWVEAVTAEGCVQRDTVYIDFLSDIVLDTVLYLCDGDPALFLGLVYDTPGLYDHFLPGTGGHCDTLWLIDVEAPEIQGAEIQVQGSVCRQGKVVLFAPQVAGGVYTWLSGQTQASISTSLPGYYAVTISYGDACLLVFDAIVPECEEPKYYIPNVFTPNGDQINDVFQVYAPDLREATMTIYDRWGGTLYQGTASPPVWDGRTRDKDAAPGVYVYRIVMRFINGAEVSEAGEVTLIR